MSILDWFNKKEKATPNQGRLNIPEDLWVKCFSCKDTLFLKDLEANDKVCTKCNYHFRLSPEERVALILDENTFEEYDAHLGPVDVLSFTDTKSYPDRIEQAKKKTKKNDAITIGTGKLNGHSVNIGVMDFSYMGGSMGSVVGEKITRMVEKAIQNKFPVLLFTASGGARMQEGILSLMQMAKTSSALHRLSEESVPYISIVCDPTTGGTSASFAMLGDVNLAEPGALISFAGARVIEQTIRQKLPKGFQRAEFLLEHGMLDGVIHRDQLRDTLFNIVQLLDPHAATPKAKASKKDKK